ncbi:MAG: TVP38/TMEM64 family protein [Nitrospira sp.]|nr:TVP38/TMEM64 family protein [Nitrospira sp.]
MSDEHKAEERYELEKNFLSHIIGPGGATWVRLIFLIVFIVLLEILYEEKIFHLFLDKNRLIAFLELLGPLAFIGFIILQIAQVVAAPIPGELTGLIGGYFFGPTLGIILSTIGLTLGSILAFLLGRFLGRPFVEKAVRKEILERFDYVLKLGHKGSFLVFLLFLIPGFPKDYLCYILGMGPMRTTEFLVISTVGRFSGTVLLTLGGTYIRRHQYKEFFLLTGIAIIIILVSMVFRDKLERLFQKWFRKHE